MDVVTEETTTACTERRELAEQRSVPFSVWRSVVHSFRHAQLQRLEARVNRLRRRLHIAPPGHEPGVMLVAAEPHQSTDTGWPSARPTRRERTRLLTGVVGVLTLMGITVSALFLHSREGVAARFFPPASESLVMTTPKETSELRTLLASLNERVTMLHHQVLQQGDQLTTQSATVLRVNQHADAQQTQVTALADALAVLTTQVVHLEQQVTIQATRLAAHEQQRATQTTQRTPMVPPPPHVSRVTAKTAGRSSRPRPPTLELFAPPSVQAPTSAPSLSAPLPTAGAPSQRRSITLPAALGAEGYRAATGTTGGTSP